MTVLHVIFCDLFSAGKKEHSPNTLWDTLYPKGHAEVCSYELAEVPCDLLPFGQKEHSIHLTLGRRLLEL